MLGLFGPKRLQLARTKGHALSQGPLVHRDYDGFWHGSAHHVLAVPVSGGSHSSVEWGPQDQRPRGLRVAGQASPELLRKPSEQCFGMLGIPIPWVRGAILSGALMSFSSWRGT